MYWIVIGDDAPVVETNGPTVDGPIQAPNPEEAVREAGMAGYLSLKVYPVGVDENGDVDEYTRDELDL